MTDYSERRQATYAGVTYANGRLPASLRARLDGKHGTDGDLDAELRDDAAAAFNRCRAHILEETGEELQLRGWYRSLEEQHEFYDRPHTQPVAVPGYSNHGLGTAVDVDDFGGMHDFDNARRRRLYPYLEEHGFTETEGRDIGEPWHLDYRASTDQHKNDDKREWYEMATKKDLEEALAAYVSSTKGRQAIARAVWNTDGVIAAPDGAEAKKNPFWTGRGWLGSIRNAALRGK